MPALYSLAFRHLLPERFAIIGVARTEGTDDGFRDAMKEAVQRHARDPFRQEVWDELAARMRYRSLDDFADDTAGANLTTRCRARRAITARAATGSTTSQSRPARSRPLVAMVARPPPATAGTG